MPCLGILPTSGVQKSCRFEIVLNISHFVTAQDFSISLQLKIVHDYQIVPHKLWEWPDQ